MPPVAAAQKKLREARFFHGRLHDTHRKFGRGAAPEEFEFYLSAFLSAGRSVLLTLEHADGNWNFFNSWQAGLVNNGRHGAMVSD